MGRVLWVVLGIAVLGAVWALAYADRVRMVDLEKGYAIGDGVEQDWTEVCFFPGYSWPLEHRARLEGLACPLWDHVEERNILVVYSNDVACTSFGVSGDFLEPYWDEYKCFAPEDIKGKVLFREEGVVKIRWH